MRNTQEEQSGGGRGTEMSMKEEQRMVVSGEGVGRGIQTKNKQFIYTPPKKKVKTLT